MDVYRDYLYHHGIKGQKWGVRRWQNKDGSLTKRGKEHYDVDGIRKSVRSEQKQKMPFGAKVDGFQPSKKPLGAKIDGPQSNKQKGKEYADKVVNRAEKISTIKKNAKTAVALGATAVATYKMYKFVSGAASTPVKPATGRTAGVPLTQIQRAQIQRTHVNRIPINRTLI